MHTEIVNAALAQLAERKLGKFEVPGSNPGGGSSEKDVSHYQFC